MRDSALAEIEKFQKFVQEKEQNIIEYEGEIKVNQDKIDDCEKALKLLGEKNET